MTSSPKQACVTLLLLVFVSLAWGQDTQCSSSRKHAKLRFVAQLSVNGCAIFVHDTGAKDGPHLAVEPLMCVTQSLHEQLPRYDSLIQLTYVSIPVTLRDDAMLSEVRHQLRHLSPKSVMYANVSSISVSTDESSVIQVLGFDWSSDESSGIIRVWCRKNDSDWSIFRSGTQVLQNLSAVAVIEVNGTRQRHKYSLMMQNHSLIDPNIRSSRYSHFPSCSQLLVFPLKINLTNCTARVHLRMDMVMSYFIEPLLCHNITSFTKESVLYDHSRDMYYLKLDLVLQDDITLNALKSQLADMVPLNVSFMRLWRAEIIVTSVLRSSFEIGPLMVSGDWRSGQVRVYCRTVGDCADLRSSVIKNPSALWSEVNWAVVSVDGNLCKSAAVHYTYQIQALMKQLNCFESDLSTCKFLATRQGRTYVVIQQRLTGYVSFARGWIEYETGFGDKTDFWIGLSTIHKLSINGVTLRVEMKLMNGSELHQEYAGFKVRDASTNYTMTCGGVIENRSTNRFDALAFFSGMQFSTMDRDNDRRIGGSCSNLKGGKSGWWFKDCPGVYVYGILNSEDISAWFKESRMMLEI